MKTHLILTTTLLLLPGGMALGQNNLINNLNSGSWHTTPNWSLGMPVTGQQVRISGNLTTTISTDNAGSGLAYIGYDAGQTGTVNVLNAKTWTLNDFFYVGFNGNGTLNVEAGGRVANDNIGYIGRNSGSTGVATVTGTDSRWDNSTHLSVGHDGNGTLNVEAGGRVTNAIGRIGYGSGSTGVATVTGTGSWWDNSSELWVGRQGNGTLNVEAGGRVTAPFVTLALEANSQGTLNLNGTAASRGVLETGYIQEGSGALGGTINFNGGILRVTGHEANFIRNFETGDVQILANGVFIDTQNFNVGITQVLQGAGGLTKQGPGTLTLNSANTYLGDTFLASGTLALGHANALGTGTLRVTSSATALQATTDLSGANAVGNDVLLSTTLNVSGSNNLTLGGTVTGNTGANRRIDNNMTGGATLELGQINISNEAAARTLFIGGSGDTAISGAIGNGSATTGNLTKDGTGVLTLSGANTYTGTTAINNGTLKLGANNVLPGNVNVGNAPGTQGTLDLNGKTDTIGALTLGSATTSVAGLVNQVIDSAGGGTLTLGGTVTYNPGTADFHRGQAVISANIDLGTANLNTNNARIFSVNDSVNAGVDLLVSGDISGSAGLFKNGAGILELSGNNSYTGSTYINNGTVRLGSDTALPSRVNINNGTTAGTLDINGTHNTVDGLLVLGNSGSVTTNGLQHRVIDSSAVKGVLTLGNSVNYLAGTGPNQNGMAIIEANLNLGTAGTRVFSVQDSSITDVDLQITGNISGAGTLSKTGAGTLELAGTNTHAGGTNVQAGTLHLAETASLASGVTVAVGATLSGGGVINGSSTILGTHSVGSSPGLQTFDGNLAYGGGSSVTWELFGNTDFISNGNADRGFVYDGIDVTGTLDFSGITTLDLSFGGTVDWTDMAFWGIDRQWLLYSVGGLTLNSVNLQLGQDNWAELFNPALAGSTFDLNRTGNDIWLTYNYFDSTNAIPEPSRALLLLGGLLGMLMRRRRA